MSDGLTLADVRARVAAGLTSALASAGWHESPYAAEMLGGEPRSVAHLSFSIAAVSSTPHSLGRQTGRGGIDRGEQCVSRLAIRWLHVIRSSEQVASYDAALREEQRLISAAVSVDGNPQLTVRWMSSSRQIVGDGTYLLGTVDVDVYHRYPLIVPLTPST